MEMYVWLLGVPIQKILLVSNLSEQNWWNSPNTLEDATSQFNTQKKTSAGHLRPDYTS
jgi:hypothetical protein